MEAMESTLVTLSQAIRFQENVLVAHLRPAEPDAWIVLHCLWFVRYYSNWSHRGTVRDLLPAD